MDARFAVANCDEFCDHAESEFQQPCSAPNFRVAGNTGVRNCSLEFSRT